MTVPTREDHLRFVDLFTGLGGFHRALSSLGHECVAAAEIDEELRDLYTRNFADVGVLIGDLRDAQERDQIPEHDILCAGFPCQPFSKSGAQRGFADLTRGTLFHEVLTIAEQHVPDLIILENVGNFARHDGGRTWSIVRGSLEALGYDVRGTEPRVAGGHGLISPHHFGEPHHRERFFVVAALWELPADPFPTPSAAPLHPLEEVLLGDSELTPREADETRLTAAEVACVEHWNEFLRSIPEDVSLPSFPLWADELGATYPYASQPPLAHPIECLQASLRTQNGDSLTSTAARDLLPPYAQGESAFPGWKKRFIRQNRLWWRDVGEYLTDQWKAEVKRMPASRRKLEWNCKGEERDLWAHVLQFRPSGLRAKRATAIPALVASTTTQVPVIGPRRRRLCRREGLRLQGFPTDHHLPEAHTSAFRALGNAVHVEVVRRITEAVLSSAPTT